MFIGNLCLRQHGSIPSYVSTFHITQVTCVHTHVHTHTPTRTHSCTHSCVHTHVYTHSHTRVHTLTHSCTHTHTHTHSPYVLRRTGFFLLCQYSSTILQRPVSQRFPESQTPQRGSDIPVYYGCPRENLWLPLWTPLAQARNAMTTHRIYPSKLRRLLLRL